jgi:DNA polymerase-1
MTSRLHIIDGSGYIFRAYYAIRALSTAGGESTNAVYGFTTMIQKALREERPELIAMTFDAPGGSSFRREIYTEYKATRSPPPEDLPAQIPRIHEITEAFRMPKFMVPGIEADDIIATLTKMALEAGLDVQIITGDKDLMQLVSDRVEIYEPMKNVRFHRKEVEEKYGVPPEKLLDALSLCGDTSDNIPGVAGVGLKTAAKLLADHGDLEGVLRAASEGRVKGKVGQSLAEQAENARLSKRLITLKDDVPLGVTIEDLRYHGPDAPRLRQLFVDLEFKRLIPTIEEEAQGPAQAGRMDADDESTVVPDVKETIDRDNYRVLTDINGVKALVAELQGTKKISIAVETTTTRSVDTELLGMSLVWERGQGAYITVRDQQALFDALRPVLEDSSVQKISSELKMVVALAERCGILVQGLAFDSTIASHLLEPDETGHSPTLVSRRYLGHEPLERPAKTAFETIIVPEAAKLVGERAEIAYRAADVMKKPLDKVELFHVLKDVEIPLVPVLARMELSGIRIDVEKLAGMSSKFAEELEKLEKACYEAAGKEFNIGSPKQLQVILFDELQLKSGKRTKTGASTDHSVLEVLANEHPLPQAILDYRQVQKLKSTYVDALPKMVSPKTGRVHTVFSQSVAATGRLSSTDPNLQNIPIRSELGRTLRKVFVADPGWMLISVDYSQIELRVLAHFSEDPILNDAFSRGIDVHTRTAAALFEIDPSAVSREQRTQAKAVNFGVLYGMGPVRLARDLKIPRRMASKFVDDYFERQKGVKKYVDDTLSFARANGYVTTLLGRRRWIADINSNNRGARAQAERIATNTPIQGSAADLIKLAMIRLDGRLREERLSARLLLQVHDELLVEAKEDEAEKVAALVKSEMEGVYPLKAQLFAEAHWGKSWDDAH